MKISASNGIKQYLKRKISLMKTHIFNQDVKIVPISENITTTICFQIVNTSRRAASTNNFRGKLWTRCKHLPSTPNRMQAFCGYFWPRSPIETKNINNHRTHFCITLQWLPSRVSHCRHQHCATRWVIFGSDSDRQWGKLFSSFSFHKCLPGMNTFRVRLWKMKRGKTNAAFAHTSNIQTLGWKLLQTLRIDAYTYSVCRNSNGSRYYWRLFGFRP